MYDDCLSPTPGVIGVEYVTFSCTSDIKRKEV